MDVAGVIALMVVGFILGSVAGAHGHFCVFCWKRIIRFDEPKAGKSSHSGSSGQGKMKDWLLFVWLMVDVMWTAFCFGGVAYVVFTLHRSGWWFLLAILLGSSMGGGGLYKALELRFGVKEEETD